MVNVLSPTGQKQRATQTGCSIVKGVKSLTKVGSILTSPWENAYLLSVSAANVKFEKILWSP